MDRVKVTLSLWAWLVIIWIPVLLYWNKLQSIKLFVEYYMVLYIKVSFLLIVKKFVFSNNIST